MEKNATEPDEDMSEIADRLYAEVHYAFGNESNLAQDTAPIKQNPNENIRIVSAHSIVSKSSEDGNSKNSNRYWSSNTSTPLKRFKSKRRYETNYSNDPNTSTQKNDPIPKVPSGNKPKAFTPYKSLMSDISIVSSTPKNNNEISNTTDELNNSEQQNNYKNCGSSSKLKETSKLIRNGGKRKNPFANEKSANNDKRLNPFSKNVAKQDKMVDKKRKTERNRKKGEKSKSSNVVYEVDSDQNDDDVIILPTPPPPMITIDSSDDENTPKRKNKSFLEPKKVNGSSNNKLQGSRCSSPTNSIMSDDFIVQTDRGRSNAFSTYVREEDLIEVNQTVDSIVRATTSNAEVNNAADVNNFTTPQESDTPKKKKNKKSKNNEPKSYQVGENSFAAVDVYESESSDMPESVYVKGIMGKRKNVSSSSSDSTVEDFNVQKSKRLKKRKSSGSQKGSDFIASSNSSESSDSDNDNEERSDTLPYLFRGEALGKVRKSQNKKLKQIKRTLSCSENPSDNEFITKLTSIGHDDSDDEEDADESKENSNESIAARDIVQSVLQKRSTRLKTISETENPNSDPETSQTENNLWQKESLNESNQIDLKNVDDGIVSPPAEKTCDNRNNEVSVDNENDEEDVVAIEPQISTIDLVDEEETTHFVANNDISVNSATSENVVLDAEHPEMGWNEEMDYFYNRSWGGENFNTRLIQSKMSKKHALWKIYRSDIFMKSTRTASARCANCFEKGHYARECKRKKKAKICAMCGGKGHLDDRCPRSICFKCGQKSPIFKFGCSACKHANDIKCYVCRSNGHKAIECPDKWRRYHNTIDSTVPVEPIDRPSTQKRKYCSICAIHGHLAENCNKPSLVKSHGRKIHSIFVKSYRDAYKPVEEFDPTVNREKFVILSKNADKRAFNYGDEVKRTGNTIYARFANKFGLEEPNCTVTSNEMRTNDSIANQSEQNLEISSHSRNNHKYFDENLSQEVNNSTMPMETSEEYYSNENSERIIDSSMTEDSECSHERRNDTKEKIDMIASLQNSLDVLNEIKKTKTDDDRKILEINSLNHDLEKLKEIKNELNHREDEPLPDFIPLTSNEPEKYTETRSENDEIEEPVTKSEAQILLSSAHCKYLLTATGHTFLKDQEEKCNVTLRMEWKDYGNVMIVRGFHRDQLRFRKALSTFLEKIDELIKSRSEVQIPKNRKSLIKHIIGQFRELDTLAVEPCAYYHKMCKNASEKTKASQKREKTFRRFLNMTLFGIYGLLDGAIHVTELQVQLRHLMLSDAANITVAQRIKIREHLNYVFSDMVIDNYADLIKKAKKIGKNPSKYVKLDRKLIGLPLKQQSNRSNKSLLMSDSSQVSNVHDTTPVHEDITLNTTTSEVDQTN